MDAPYRKADTEDLCECGTRCPSCGKRFQTWRPQEVPYPHYPQTPIWVVPHPPYITC